MAARKSLFIRGGGQTWRWMATVLLVFALILFLVSLYVPEIRIPGLTAFGYVLLIAAAAALVVAKTLESIHQARLREARVRCSSCGWVGSGAAWIRTRGCPDCDSSLFHLEPPPL